MTKSMMWLCSTAIVATRFFECLDRQREPGGSPNPFLTMLFEVDLVRNEADLKLAKLNTRLPCTCRWYVSRFRSIAEKTDAGRVALPSVLKLMENAFLDESRDSPRSTSEIWDATNRILMVCSSFQRS